MLFRSARPAALAAGLLLAACGDGEGNTNASANTSTPPVANASPEGIYTGTIESQFGTFPLIGAITRAGDLRLINTDTTNTSNTAQYGGRLTVTGSTVAGRLQFFNRNTLAAGQMDVQGTVVAGNRLTGTFVTSDNDRGTFSLNFSTLYSTGYPLATLAGNYTGTSRRNGGQSTATVTDTGAISGTTEFGCPFTGQLTTIDPARNLYAMRANFNETRCESLGKAPLEGLAFYDPGDLGQRPGLTAIANNALAGYYAQYTKPR